MATILFGAALLVGCSACVGQGICALAGRERWAWWAPAVGFAALLAVAGTLIRAPGHSKSVAFAIAVLTLASLASRPVRAAVVSALPDGLPVAVFSLLVTALPFFMWGRAGIIGAGVNNDLGAHLGTAWWLQHKHGPAPVGALGGPLALVGYPLGPHGLADALSLNKLALVHTFDAVIVCVPALIALTALGALPGAFRPVRWFAAALVGLSYMVAAFTAQSSFKETMEALLVVGVVLATRDAFTDRELFDPLRLLRAGIPIGVLIAGSAWVYSYGGIPWTLGAAVAVALTSGPLRRRLVPVMWGALIAGAIVLGPALVDIFNFKSSPFNHESGNGNLGRALNPIEGLGVWLNSDFRWTPNPLWPTILLATAAGIVAIVALVRLIRAGQIALPAALVPVLAIFAWAADAKSIYLSAKALTIAAPLILLTIAAGVLWPRIPREPRALRIPLFALAAIAACAAGLSSFWALRDARVAPEAHAAELSALKPQIRDGAVLFLGKDDLIQWELVGLPMFKGSRFYAPLSVPVRPSKSQAYWGFLDFDSFVPSVLDGMRYAITTRTPFQSLAPRNWKEVAHTRSFILWKREHAATPYRISADFPDRPGRVLRCADPYGQQEIAYADGGFALVWPKPIVGRQVRWHGIPFQAGQSATMTLHVPRGRWDLSLEYASMVDLHVHAENVDKTMPASIDRVGPFYYVGTVTQARSGPLTITVRMNRMNGLARLLGARGYTRALDSPSNRPLNSVALIRHHMRVRRVKARAACGRWVDYVQPRHAAGTP